MKIIKLTAENFKRLRAVEIEPDGAVVVVRGRNAQGKSSVLDAIWAALGGKDAVPGKPIRDGEDHAEITLDLGQYVVTRTFTAKDSYLTVRNGDGAKIQNPQALLDSLIGSISFDPLEFARMKPGTQAKQLAEITGVDFSKLNEERKRAFDERTLINREVKRLTASVAEMEEPLARFDPGSYSEPVSLDDVMYELKAAQEKHSAHGYLQEECRRSDERIKRTQQEIATLRAQLQQAQDTLTHELKESEELYARLETDGAALPDVDSITAKFRTSQEHNELVKAFKILASRRTDLSCAMLEADKLTATIEALDARKSDMVSQADLPVNHLTFDETGVYYHGVPFDQCSSSEQLKVSTALAISFNPKLRVIRITDGSLLDEESMDVLASIAESQDFQIWLERVDDREDGPGIRIEDGTVANAEVEAAA